MPGNSYEGDIKKVRMAFSQDIRAVAGVRNEKKQSKQNSRTFFHGDPMGNALCTAGCETSFQPFVSSNGEVFLCRHLQRVLQDWASVSSQHD